MEDRNHKIVANIPETVVEAVSHTSGDQPRIARNDSVIVNVQFRLVGTGAVDLLSWWVLVYVNCSHG